MRGSPRRARSAHYGARRHKARQWLDLGPTGITVTAGAVTSLVAFEAPTLTAGTPLTADPPEDQTLLRILADFTVVAPAAMSDTWFALLLVDRTWTPVGTANLAADGDKRILWSRYYSAMGTTSPGVWTNGLAITTGVGTAVVAMAEAKDRTDIDITPKVKLEDGKHLVMVCYTGATPPTSATLKNTRVLMQRSGR